MTRARGLSIVLALVSAAAPCAAQRAEYVFTVAAGRHSHRDVVVSASVELPDALARRTAGRVLRAQVKRNGQTVASQVEARGSEATVSWRVDALEAGAAIEYRATVGLGAPDRMAPAGFVVKQVGADAVVEFANRAVARYDATTGPNKPYLYPVYGPTDRLAVRPLPGRDGGSPAMDHPHHRGIWFTHGSVNGVDFWSEGSSAGRTVHRGYDALVSGPVFGAIKAATEWQGRDGKQMAADNREIRFTRTRDAVTIDWDITVRPAGVALTFGDTKEGSFGLRVPDAMRLAGGNGRIVNSENIANAATWGKRARWVGYSGSLEGETVGVTILDHPGNLRHPTYWHVRDYGLFAVNPFGIHDFEKGRPADAGAHVVPANGSQRFRYRIILHRGTPEQAGAESAWQSYAEPPTVTVRAVQAGRR